jgi:hypothetical protein
LELPITFEEALDICLFELRDLLLRKGSAYGNANMKTFGETGALVRAYDKVGRLKNILWDNRELTVSAETFESLYETWRDLAGYGVLAMIMKRGWLELPWQDDKGAIATDS